MGTIESDLLIALVGLAVGAVSTWTGLGAGLALPALALLGMPLSATLLAVKLPVAASDLAAGFLPAPGDRSSLPGGRLLAVAASAGMVASLAVLHLPQAWAVAGVTGLALWAWRMPPGARSGLLGVLPWSGYIGACGVGAGWLRRARAWQRHEDWRCSERAARQLAAAANVGAVTVLAAAGQGIDGAIGLLALTQAAGAWAVAAWRGSPARARGAATARSS